MTRKARRPGQRAVITSTEAHLFVSDVTASCAFYARNLGFAVAFRYGDPPFYAQVTRDRAKLNLRWVPEPVFAGDVREREELLSASLTVAKATDLKALFASYERAGVPFHQTLKTAPWGATTFVVKDPDGNLLLFAGPSD